MLPIAKGRPVGQSASWLKIKMSAARRRAGCSSARRPRGLGRPRRDRGRQRHDDRSRIVDWVALAVVPSVGIVARDFGTQVDRGLFYLRALAAVILVEVLKLVLGDALQSQSLLMNIWPSGLKSA
jgi:hypothetical protein